VNPLRFSRNRGTAGWHFLSARRQTHP
jgi:hypothetical protein